MAFAAHRRGGDHGDTLRGVRIERRGRADSPIQLPSALVNRPNVNIYRRALLCSSWQHVQCGPMLLCDRLVHAEHGPSGSMVSSTCSHRGFLATCACATPSGSAIALDMEACSVVHVCDREMPQQRYPGAMQPRPPPRLYVTASRSCTRWRLVIVLHSPKGPCRLLQPATTLCCGNGLGIPVDARNLSYRCSAPQPIGRSREMLWRIDSATVASPHLADRGVHGLRLLA